VNFFLFYVFFIMAGCTTSGDTSSVASKNVTQTPNLAKSTPHPSYSIVAELFPGIRGITFDANQTLYISDTEGTFHPSKKIYSLKKPYDGELTALPMVFAMPTGLAFKDNNLFVADHGKSEVFQFSSSFEKIRRWKADSPIALLDTPKGLLSLSSGGAVELLRSNGKVDQIFSGLVNPTAFTYTSDGHLWVAESGSTFVKPRVSKRDFKGLITKTIDHTWRKPSGLAVDKFHQLWIADPENNAVYVSLDAKLSNGDSVFNTPAFFTQFSSTELLLLEDGNRPRLIKVSIE